LELYEKILRMLVIAGIILFFFNVTTYAETGKCFFNPDTAVVSPYDSFEVKLQVDSNLRTIHCFLVSVYFDSSLIQLLDVLEGSLLPAHGTTAFFWNYNGSSYDISSCLMGYGLFANGPGVLATMKFRAKGWGGVTPLTFTNVEFYDTANHPNLIPVNSINGTVIVSRNQVPFLQQSSTWGLFLIMIFIGVFLIWRNLQSRRSTSGL
jgi:hypothetical protein